jgi:hypothetical protein
MMVVQLDCLALYQGTAPGLATSRREQWEQMESYHHKNRAMGKVGEAKQTSQAQPLEKKKWQCACRLFGTNSLKEDVVWLVHLLPGNNHEISNYTTAVTRQQP